MPELRDFLSTEKLRAYAARSSSVPVVAGASIGSPAAIIIVWALETFVVKAPLPGPVAIAIGGVVTALATRFMPGGKGHASKNP